MHKVTVLIALVRGALAACASYSGLGYYPDISFILSLMGTRYEQDAAGWAQASPVTLASADDAPMFIYHGTWDMTVGVKNAEAMKRALDAAAGVPAEP